MSSSKIDGFYIKYNICNQYTLYDFSSQIYYFLTVPYRLHHNPLYPIQLDLDPHLDSDLDTDLDPDSAHHQKNTKQPNHIVQFEE